MYTEQVLEVSVVVLDEEGGAKSSSNNIYSIVLHGSQLHQRNITTKAWPPAVYTYVTWDESLAAFYVK